MAHHVMSDIQGEADCLHAMLEGIQFSEDHTLILLREAISMEIRRWNENGNAPTKVLSLIQNEEKRIAYVVEIEDKGEHLKILHTSGFSVWTSAMVTV